MPAPLGGPMPVDHSACSTLNDLKTRGRGLKSYQDDNASSLLAQGCKAK
eukprot:gene37355-37324_t